MPQCTGCGEPLPPTATTCPACNTALFASHAEPIVSGGRIPPICTCCLASTTNHETASSSGQAAGARTTRYYNVTLPKCTDCASRATAFTNGRIIAIGSLLILVAIGTGRSSLASNGGAIVAILLVVGVAAFAGWHALGRSSVFLRRGHVPRCHSITVKKGGDIVAHNKAWATVQRRLPPS